MPGVPAKYKLSGNDTINTTYINHLILKADPIVPIIDGNNNPKKVLIITSSAIPPLE